MDNYIGKRLDGRYEITELIGQGGMANVYKATDVLDNRIVAVKILKREFSESDEFLRRFRNESKAIAVLSHPNIVKIYDMGFSEKLQYIVMEYIDGITLKEYIDSERVLNWKDAVHFIIHSFVRHQKGTEFLQGGLFPAECDFAGRRLDSVYMDSESDFGSGRDCGRLVWAETAVLVENGGLGHRGTLHYHDLEDVWLQFHQHSGGSLRCLNGDHRGGASGKCADVEDF